ncbi:MAG: ISL3 family transposase [Pirellula sp.]|jgi:transposase
MEDKELYQHLLGLKTPWTVKEVKLNVQAEEIAVQVNHPRGTKFCCPECQRELPCYDHGEERRWRHVDSCQFKTILIAQVPRVNCPEHGDVSPAYVKATKQCIPLAESKIVHDIFHVMQLANKAVDNVRKAEHRQLKGEGDDQLMGSKYLWLTSYENLTSSQVERFESLCTLSLETGRAWSYKELLRDLWAHETEAEAKSFFKQWYNRVIHTKLEPMKELAHTLKERIDNIVTYCTHGITNSVAEGINSKIMSIKRRAGGFRNRENFKTAIFFYCGGLDLHTR